MNKLDETTFGLAGLAELDLQRINDGDNHAPTTTTAVVVVNHLVSSIHI
jgi:hypothetical protein